MNESLDGFFRRHALDEATSTNDVARELALEGAPAGTLVTAKQQSGGRGRRDNSWSSPQGNVYLSLILRPSVPAADAAQLSFVAAVALAEVISARVPAHAIAVKWPNDILVDERKVSGILLEAGPIVGERLEWVVVGVGINVQSSPPRIANAASLVSLGDNEADPETITTLFCESLRRWLEVWRHDGFGPIRQAWLTRAYKRGKPIEIRLPAEVFEGVFDGIDESGALLARLPNGRLRSVAGGEVHFGQAPD